ncbi:sensor histidine kinase [Halosimplex sp. TS25]|uniref:sensor histidine kinase n=1 Tax=Halosimplex rarum TaxID=3396619 RepID=UPI0039EA2174
MASDGADGDSAALTVPIDSIPDPVAGYDCPEGDPVVAVTNEAFDASFGGEAAGEPLERWLPRETAATDATATAVCSSLAEGRSVDVELGTGRADASAAGPADHRLRTLDGAATGAVDGYVLLTAPSGDARGTGSDRIASVIGHDLRNPLDVANAHLRAARETGDPEHFDQVRRSHDRMERIVRDVLALARGPEALDTVADVAVESVATDAWATVETDDASLAVADDLSTVAADADRLQRLFENLFRNAVEHGSTNPPSHAPEDAVEHGSTSPGSQARQDADGTSSVEPSVADAPEDAVEPCSTDRSDAAGRERDRDLRVTVGGVDGGFFVADDGVGVPPDERERVFEPGYSAADGEGTGLGLTIVERIAEAHGWCVSLTDGRAGGARFEFRPRSATDCET